MLKNIAFRFTRDSKIYFGGLLIFSFVIAMWVVSERKMNLDVFLNFFGRVRERLVLIILYIFDII